MSRYDVIIFFYKYINIKYKHEYFIFHILDEKCECYDWSSRQCYPCPWGGWTGAQESFCPNRNKDFSLDPTSLFCERYCLSNLSHSSPNYFYWHQSHKGDTLAMYLNYYFNCYCYLKLGHSYLIVVKYQETKFKDLISLWNDHLSGHNEYLSINRLFYTSHYLRCFIYIHYLRWVLPHK